MTKHTRNSEFIHLHNLARKARRRGDVVEATRWYRASAVMDAVIDRYGAGIQRDIRFEYEHAGLQRAEKQAAREEALRNTPGTRQHSQQQRKEAWQKYDAEHGTNYANRKSTYRTPGT